MGRVNFRAYEPGLFRKVACGSWRTAGDPSVYALLEIEMSKALEFARAYSQQHGVRITPTLLVAKAISHCLQVRPELNGLLRHGRVYLRRNVSIFFQVNVPGSAVDGNRDERIAKAVLSGTTVHETETKSLAEIARAFRCTGGPGQARTGPRFQGWFPHHLAAPVAPGPWFSQFGQLAHLRPEPRSRVPGTPEGPIRLGDDHKRWGDGD